MKVIQLIDSLHAGGAERVAVNFANSLVSHIDESFICSTREEGMLKNSIHKNVKYLFLNKKRKIDISAIVKLNRYVKSNNIHIIHAHSSSFFLATIVKLMNRNIKLVWHDHYGNSEFLKDRKSKVLKFCSKFFSHIFCVNRNLETWAKQYLKTIQVSYLPNFAVENNLKAETNLFGINGKRIICLANLRPQKDHLTLIRAFSNVIKNHPKWTLHLVGKDFNDDCSKKIKEEIKNLKFDKHIFLYGSRPDIGQILKQCEIGVLSSKSEGLPLALLEYGMAGLAVVSTNVGEINTVVGSEKNGILVEVGNHKNMADALMKLIADDKKRDQLAFNFSNQIKLNFSSEAIINKILIKYRTFL